MMDFELLNDIWWWNEWENWREDASLFLYCPTQSVADSSSMKSEEQSERLEGKQHQQQQQSSSNQISVNKRQSSEDPNGAKTGLSRKDTFKRQVRGGHAAAYMIAKRICPPWGGNNGPMGPWWSSVTICHHSCRYISLSQVSMHQRMEQGWSTSRSDEEGSELGKSSVNNRQ